MQTTILVVDDSEVMRQTIRRMLACDPNVAVVAEAGDGAEAVKLAQQLAPDVALVDIGMKGVNGIEATAQMQRRSPRTAVVIVTVYKLEQYVIRALAAGARGYLLKESLDEEELLRAIRTVRNGGRFFSPSIAGIVPKAAPAGAEPS